MLNFFKKKEKNKERNLYLEIPSAIRNSGKSEQIYEKNTQKPEDKSFLNRDPHIFSDFISKDAKSEDKKSYPGETPSISMGDLDFTFVTFTTPKTINSPYLFSVGNSTITGNPIYKFIAPANAVQEIDLICKSMNCEWEEIITI